MIIAKAVLIVSALLILWLSYQVWSKQRFRLLAGYVEGSIKEEERKLFAIVNGLFLMMYGIWTLTFSIFLSENNFDVFFYVWFIAIIVMTIVHIVFINIKFN
ncbi:hypothetical protein [Paenisporosarcina sp. NPDC076898]|uniref:hypothetical protein n=1 Tax=unclassified Paenisporosarcina TaxID=2642018 RepID=UPI003D0455CA